jgi:hypothetical protein
MCGTSVVKIPPAGRVVVIGGLEKAAAAAWRRSQITNPTRSAKFAKK